MDEIAPAADFIKVWIDAQGGAVPKLTAPVRRRGLRAGAQARQADDGAHRHGGRRARRWWAWASNILVHNVRDREIEPDFIDTLKRRNVSVVSTLAREESMFVYGDRPRG